MQGSKRDTDVKNRLLDYMGEGKGEMIWENIETCILPYVKQMTQCKFNVWNRVLKVGALENPAGWGGEGWGEGSGWGATCAPMADSCQCMAKTITIL